MNPPTFAEVGRVLRGLSEDHEAMVHAASRRTGGNSTRWGRADMGRLANAIARMEDRLELTNPRFDRTEMRAIRRRLEEAAEGAGSARRTA